MKIELSKEQVKEAIYDFVGNKLLKVPWVVNDVVPPSRHNDDEPYVVELGNPVVPPVEVKP